ncbi:hypothetical protein WMF39_10820 [Sorangium sp. So ce1504]|uniref:hypothetical protein n=1 Tax=Sorangium sp. So ce1504 TaxID=3133337 RepID=UPI003F6005AD
MFAVLVVEGMMAHDVSLNRSLLKKRKENCCASPLDGGRVEPQSITNQALSPCALLLIFYTERHCAEQD